jgi:hypothetical protein
VNPNLIRLIRQRLTCASAAERRLLEGLPPAAKVRALYQADSAIVKAEPG